MLSIVLLEKSLKAKIYPCGGTYIYIDLPSEEALPPPLVCTGIPGPKDVRKYIAVKMADLCMN